MKSLQDVLNACGNPVELLCNSRIGFYGYPVVGANVKVVTE
ncbi:hypothetical protein ACFFP0_01520 [Rhizobium puerariae]|uniref:Uncharacterized protein n=1 Tax=Rhizobium puerariae TaxID=1585791 RepID=A0ABV6AAD8_9HYPH